MRKPVFYFLFMLSLFMAFAAGRVSAQQEAPDEDIDFIVDDALDLIEEHLDGTAAPPRELTPLPVPGIEISGEIVAVPDEDTAQALEIKSVPLAHAEASGVIAALEGMKSPGGEVAYDAAGGAIVLKDTAEKIAAMSAYIKQADIPLETEVFRLTYVKAEDIIERIRQQLTEGVGKAEPDEQAGSIIVTDTPEAAGRIRAYIKEADRLNKAVRVETKILRIVLNEEHERGVDWEAIVSDYQTMDVPGFSGAEEAASGSKLSLGVVTKEDYAVLLDALDTVGAITTVGEEAATVDYAQHKTVKIPSVNQGGEGDVSDIAGQVHLDVVTSYNSDGTQTVAVKPGPLAGHPGRAMGGETAGAEIQVENESTVVIGGLFEEVMVESTWKIPLLGDLPLLGFVFRNEGEVPRRAEVITFLTLKTVEKN